MSGRISALFLALILIAGTLSAQNLTPDRMYRPVVGYVIDTCSTMPVKDVVVYSFDSFEDALKGKATLSQTWNTKTFNRKGDILETVTDASGRYLIPALSDGALMFFFRDRKEIVIKKVLRRSSVSLGKKEEERKIEIKPLEFDLSSLDGYSAGRITSGLKLDLDFNYYLPYSSTSRSDSRLTVERRIVDLETGEVLSSSMPVVRDGKTYHRKMRKLRSKSDAADSIYRIAERFRPLTDTTSSVRIKDDLNAEKWKDHCFKVGYFIDLDEAGKVRHLDTLYMMTNRVGRPLKFLQHVFEPYVFEPEESVEPSGRAVRRKLTLRGEYDGNIPEVLRDSIYELTVLHIKAVVPPLRTYVENMALADSLVQAAMEEHRTFFAGKLDSEVRVTRTSEVVRWSAVADMLASEYPDVSSRIRRAVKRHGDDVDAQTADVLKSDGYSEVVAPLLEKLQSVEYRYDFLTARRFSQKEYLERFASAEDDEVLEWHLRRAIEESQILEGRPWDYPANELAALYIRNEIPDTSILSPFADRSLQVCDIDTDDPVTGRHLIRNRQEMVANQAMMHILDKDYALADSLVTILPESYRYLSDVAHCMEGEAPFDAAAIVRLSNSSLQNKVVMDMYRESVGERTAKALEDMPEDKAITWYLRARYLCIIYENDVPRMQSEKMDGQDVTVYETVVSHLRKCFQTDGSLVDDAVLDSDVNETALKEVLGVYVL